MRFLPTRPSAARRMTLPRRYGCGRVYFWQYPDASAAGGAAPQQGMAAVDGDGIVACVTTEKYGDGLLPGKYKVYIETLQGSRPRVAKHYLNEATTPLTIDTANLPLDIKVPKP